MACACDARALAAVYQLRGTVVDNSLFRKSSLDRVQSPEQLNDYIRVPNPSGWVVVIATLVFLIAALIWGALAWLPAPQAASEDAALPSSVQTPSAGGPPATEQTQSPSQTARIHPIDLLLH